jgi:hypothetical protein
MKEEQQSTALEQNVTFTDMGTEQGFGAEQYEDAEDDWSI